MQVFHRLEEIQPLLNRTHVAIGNFDGVHLGHQALLTHLVEESKKANASPTVLTFFPHPIEVLDPHTKLERLTTAAEKLVLFEQLGIEWVLVEPFNDQLASLTADEFLKRYLLDGLHAAGVDVGFNFRFGKGRAGDTELLQKFAAKNQMKAFIENSFEIEGKKVSSSFIRERVRSGEIREAAKYLGRPYSLNGVVKIGDGRGRQLGFPTANLEAPLDKLLPKNGVYLTRAFWQRQSFLSVTNIGIRPTFWVESTQPHIEVHLLDFDNRLYDETLEIQFLDRIREEKRFATVDELKKQIERDVEWALKYNKVL